MKTSERVLLLLVNRNGPESTELYRTPAQSPMLITTQRSLSSEEICH